MRQDPIKVRVAIYEPRGEHLTACIQKPIAWIFCDQILVGPTSAIRSAWMRTPQPRRGKSWALTISHSGKISIPLTPIAPDLSLYAPGCRARYSLSPAWPVNSRFQQIGFREESHDRITLKFKTFIGCIVHPLVQNGFGKGHFLVGIEEDDIGIRSRLEEPLRG